MTGSFLLLLHSRPAAESVNANYVPERISQMPSKKLHRLATAAVFSVVTLFATATAYASPVAEWRFFQAPGSLGSDARDAAKPGGAPHAKAQLFQSSSGGYTFRIQGASTDECFVREVTAMVEKTPTTTTITPSPRFVACPRIRLVINNDGTGGTVQVNMGKRGADAWLVDEDHEYDLRPL